MSDKNALLHQFEAALATVKACVVACPDQAWNKPVANLAFCQAAFHAVFFADYYLDRQEGALRDEAFHKDHARFFRDYEELQDRPQTLLYDRPTLLQYIDHCHRKAERVFAAETDESLVGASGFSRRKMTRAELHIYAIRHLQHHAGQLSLRLRLDDQIDIPWFSGGWPNPVV